MVETSVRPREDGLPAADHTADAESLAGLYAFGILEGGELARFERHLAGCGRCAEVVKGDQAMVMALSLTAPEAEPSPDLKDRLLARAAAELADQSPVSSGESRERMRPTAIVDATWSRLKWLLPVAAILIALLAGGGLLGRELARTQVVATTPLDNRSDRGEAVVLIRRNGEATVQLHDVGNLTDGRVYQGWVIPPGGTPIATGASASGNGSLSLEGDVRGMTVAVTLEPGPGATVPSVRPFLVGRVPV